MGIHGLSKVIADHAPKALLEGPLAQYFGRKVAIDASMSIYQFLIAVRSEGNVLTNEAGETTSHLSGMFYRTVRMMENGLKPIYVFDGKPPDLKSSELLKRTERRTEAEQQAKLADEEGSTEALDKFNRRTVKVTKRHNDECKKLLGLMGVPCIQAPGEAEAQCAAIVKAGLAFAVGSEDMDTLTFGAPVLLRHLTFSEARKMSISEIHLPPVLEGLSMTMDQFIDLCILLGCDYCETIKGIGPMRAVALLKEFKTIEAVVENLDTERYKIPEDWNYQKARELFHCPHVLQAEDPALNIKWEAADVEALVQFMVNENGFNEKRIRGSLEKLSKAKNTSSQGRLDSFFKPVIVAQRATNMEETEKENGSAKKAKQKNAKSAVAKKKTVKAKK